MLAELYATAVQGRVAIGDKSGERVERLGRRRDARPLFLRGELCCDIEGFSLHAKVEIEGHDRDAIERLCRYLARPPIATERLAQRSDGRVVYGLRRHWKGGTSAVVFDPLDFIARLSALVPRPRAHQLTYHGVLAPAAEWRDWIVPSGGRSTRREPSQALAAAALRPHRARWAELLKRVFEIDVLTCRWCGEKRKLIALLTDGTVVRRILQHLGLPTSSSLSLRHAHRPSSSSQDEHRAAPPPASMLPAEAFVDLTRKTWPPTAFERPEQPALQVKGTVKGPELLRHGRCRSAPAARRSCAWSDYPQSFKSGADLVVIAHLLPQVLAGKLP